MIKYDDNMWMGTSDSIQIRNEETGDLVSELPGVKAYKISTVADRIWVVGDGTVRSYHPTVIHFPFPFPFPFSLCYSYLQSPLSSLSSLPSFLPLRSPMNSK